MGLVLSATDAAAHVSRRQGATSTDALQVVSLSADGRRFPTEVLRAILDTANPACAQAPAMADGVAGMDPAGFVATTVPAVDRVVGARLAERASRLAAAPLSRAQHVERAFLEAASRASIFIERPDLRTEASVAGQALATALRQQHGIAGDIRRPEILAAIVDRFSQLITTTRPFLRWDALVEPVVVPRFAYSEAESQLRLVIRSGVTQGAPGDPDLTITPPGRLRRRHLGRAPGARPGVAGRQPTAPGATEVQPARRGAARRLRRRDGKLRSGH